MKKQLLLLLLLITSFVTAAEQSTPYVLTEFPLAILPADSAVWIKWTGTARPEIALNNLVDSGTIYFSREPGGSVIENYEGQIDSSETIQYNVTFTDKGIPERGIKFQPDAQSQMESGIYYLMVGFETDIGTFYSNEIKFIVRNAQTPKMLAPTGDGITDVTPTFKWESISDVPYYHVIVTDEAISMADDNSLEGLSIIWQAITASSQIVYGAPDPSGTITASPPPLSPGVDYSWFVLNNYGNNPAMTAVDVKLPKIFSLLGDTMKTALPLLPAEGDSLKSSDFESTPFKLTWTNLDSNANTYKVYLYASSQDSVIDAQIAIWDGEVTAGSFAGSDTGSIEVDAKSILTTNKYTWKVIAVDSKGYGQTSKGSSFHYSSITGGALVRTYENIKTADAVVQQPVGLCEIQVEVLDGSMETPLLFYTDQNGYLYRSRPVGTYRLTAVKDGYKNSSKTVTITEGDTSKVTLYLERPDATIYGKVNDATGTPLNIAAVEVVSTFGDTAFTETDPAGNFVVNCGKGDWDVTVSKSGYTSAVPIRVTVDFAESKSLDSPVILTKNSYVLSGFVYNKSGEPLVAAKVLLKDENGTVVAENPSTQSSGQFSFSINPGKYTLTVSKTGFSSFFEVFDLTSTTQKSITLAAGAAQITGSIFGENWSFTGVPTIAAIRDMAVIAYSASGDEVASTETDSWGTFTLGVPGGFTDYTLKYSAPGYLADSGVIKGVSSGVTYSYADTLTGYANLRGSVRRSGEETPVGDIQVTLVDTASGEILVTGQSDVSGDVEFYALAEGVYRIVAAGSGLFADSIKLEQSSALIEASVIDVKGGRVYFGETLILGFDITVVDGAGSILWSSLLHDDMGSADVKVITPLITKVSAGDTLSNVGLGDYRIEADAVDVRILDCSRHITTVSENNALLEDTIVLPFRHDASDSVQQLGTDISLSVSEDASLLGTAEVSEALIFYKDIGEAEYRQDTLSSHAGNVLNFVVVPPKTGSHLEYYFRITLDNGDEYGYSKQVSRTYIEPDKSMITRLELVPASDTSGYIIPQQGMLKLELRGYFGDNYNALDLFESKSVSWSSTGPLSIQTAADKGAAEITGTGEGAGTISATFHGGASFTLAPGVDSVVTRKMNVSRGMLASINVIRVSSHADEGFISNLETAQFNVSALDSDGNNVSVSPLWSVYPKAAGAVSSNGIFTPASGFAGRVQVVATVNDTIRAEYSDGTKAGMLVGFAVRDSSEEVTVYDGFGLSLTFPESSAVAGSPVKMTVQHPTHENTVYKTIPQEGVSLVSRIYMAKRESAAKFRSDSVTIGIQNVSRASLVEAAIKIPEIYYDFIDDGASHFTVAVWNDDSLAWSYKWKESQSKETRAEDSLPAIFSSLRYSAADSSFYVSVGDTLNGIGKIELAVLFREEGDVQGNLFVSPNPFSPYIAPMNDFVFLEGMSPDIKGTCFRITPMSSTTGNNPKITANIYTANRTLVWEAVMNNTIPGKNYYLFWDGRTRRGRGSSGDIITEKEDFPIRPRGDEMCRNGRYFLVVSIDDGETQKRFTKEIILFK